MTDGVAISPVDLKQSLASFPPPAVLDVRRQPAFAADPRMIPGAMRHAPEDVEALAATLEPWRPVIAYCVHGHEAGRDAAAILRGHGLDARHLEGGLEAWDAAGFATQAWRAPTRWVTRARPRIDRIACPWLIRRFLDPAAEIAYVPSATVRAFAAEHGATPFDVPDVEYTHVGRECSFDAFIRLHALDDPALARLATVVRGADTSAPQLAPEAPGLLSVSRGLSALFGDDHAMLKWGMLVYDALYVACRDAIVARDAATPVSA
jgi:rhodanese-related sulfurtransferase